MKIFIWERVDKCSGNWHPEGGVAVIAETEEKAREFADNYHKETDTGFVIHAKGDCKIRPDELPDFVAEIDYNEPKIFIIPDAGCC